MLNSLPSTLHPDKIPRTIAHCACVLVQPKCFLSLCWRSSPHFSLSPPPSSHTGCSNLLQTIPWPCFFPPGSYQFPSPYTPTTFLPGFLCLPCAHLLPSADWREDRYFTMPSTRRLPELFILSLSKPMKASKLGHHHHLACFMAFSHSWWGELNKFLCLFIAESR